MITLKIYFSLGGKDFSFLRLVASFLTGLPWVGPFGKSSKQHWHNYNRYFEWKWFISSIIKLILTQSTLFTTWEPHLSKHSRHSIISLFFSLPFLLLFQLSLLPVRQSIGKLISYICFPFSKLPGRFIFQEWFRVWSFLLRALIMKAALWPSARTLK